MTKFKVYFECINVYDIDVEADTTMEAIKKAEKIMKTENGITNADHVYCEER